MRFRSLHSSDSIIPLTLGCALGLLGLAPAQRVQPLSEFRLSPGRFIGLEYQPLSRRLSRDIARAVRKEASRLDQFPYYDRRPGLLRTKSIYSLAENQADPAADWLEEAVASTEGSEQAVLRSDLAAVLLARSWPERQGRPGIFPRGDDLFFAAELAAEALEVVPDFREAQFNLALALEAIGLVETSKGEWRRYLALDAVSPWANEARGHLRRLSVPIAIKERPNALQPEGPLDESDPAARSYRAGRVAFEEQRYNDARVAFREARTLWRPRDPRLAGWATYRVALCDYFDPKTIPRNVPHGDGPHFHFYEGPAGGTIVHRCNAFSRGEDLSAVLDESEDPELVARATYLMGNQESGLRTEDANHVFGIGLRRAYETGDEDLIARLESSFAVQLRDDRHRAGLHHLAAIRGSLRARSPETRLTSLSNLSGWTANWAYWHLTTFIGQESARWISQHHRDLDPVSALQADLSTAWSANNENKLALSRAAILNASNKVLRIPDPELQSVLMDQIFVQDRFIHIAEQKALFGRQPQQISKGQLALIDRDRLTPVLESLYLKMTFCPCTNLWPLTLRIQRAMEARENRVADIPVIRRYDWLTPSRSRSEGHFWPRQDPIVNVFGPRTRSEPFFAHTALVFPASDWKSVNLTYSSTARSSQQRWMKLTRLKAEEYRRDWQQRILTPRSERFQRASEGLMRDVGLPFVQTLSPEVEKVGIVEGRSALDFLPFAAIRDPHSGRFLVELYELFVLPEYSANPEKYFSQPVERTLPPLGVATRARAIGTFPAPRPPSSSDPRALLVVGSASTDDPEPLRGGDQEVEELARRFPNHRILRGAEATKENVLAELRTATIAHFAAHGWVDDYYPDETGLILGPGKRGGVRLTVGDLRNLDAPNLRLVVLSTCNSARATTSPESLSLASAFVARGVPAVVASLASIQDRTAPKFFGGFYSHLDRTGDPIRALRSTQLDFAKKPDPEGTLRIWSPYVVMVTPGFRISEGGNKRDETLRRDTDG